MEKKFIMIMTSIVLLLAIGLGLRLFLMPPYEKGDIIEFGGATWIVLEATRNTKLIVSEYALESRAYHSEEVDITWADSDIRRWLNDEFYNRFTEEERSQIAETRLTNSDNPWFYGLGGQDTIDKIFLLSLEEVLIHFGNIRQIPPSGLTGEDQFGIFGQFDDSLATTDLDGAFSWWWLRSPGVVDSFAMIVVDKLTAAGVDELPVAGVSVSGSPVDSNMFGVRPAMWINL